MWPERGIILAAGKGERLKWLTRRRPKALMPVGGRPIVERVILHLAAQGVHEIAINVHHHADLIEQALGDGGRLGVRLHYSREATLLDSGGGVRQALARLPGEGPVVVHNADVLADVDVRRLAECAPPAGAALALVANPEHHRRGDFALRDGRVVPPAQGESLTFAGVSVWDAEVLAGYPLGRPFPLTDAMRSLMAAGRLYGRVHAGYWFDIGRPRDLWRARRFVAGGC